MSAPMKCPSDETMVAYRARRLAPETEDALEEHFATCSSCRDVLVQWMRGEEDESSPRCETDARNLAPRDAACRAAVADFAAEFVVSDGVLPRGASVGRFLIVERLGQGGMGVVYLAYDPVLNRRVALKLLRPSFLINTQNVTARRRLLREAQAMAQLSHPNVVSVHEAQEVDGQVALTMEYVEGRTLRAWLQEQERTWQAICEVFVSAGQGLAAAHRAGLVHRDFKPENVLIANDGRVLVTDFGLARAAQSGKDAEFTDSEESAEEPLSQPGGPTFELSLTKTGAVVGTPAYMSPEQIEGDTADARSDQFSFCVALYEALYKERPFAGKSLRELRDRMSSGEIVQVQPATKVPRWIRETIVRGLHVQPDRRHPSMLCLLKQLSKERSSSKNVAGWVGALLLVAAALGIGLASWGADSRTICQQGARHLQGVWDTAVYDGIARTFLATGSNNADFTAERVKDILDTYRQQWLSKYRDVCEATHLHGDQSEGILDLRMACLKKRLVDVRALVDVLRKADSAVVDKAVAAATSVSPVDGCDDIDRLKNRLLGPSEPAARAAIEAVDVQIAQARALHAAGKYSKAKEAGAEAVVQAQKTGHEPVLARAYVEHSRALFFNAKHEEALGSAKKGFHLALRHTELLTAMKGASRVVSTEAALLNLKETAVWGEIALSLASRSGVSVLNRAHAMFSMGKAQRGLGNYKSAEVQLRRALSLYEAASGDQEPNIARCLCEIGAALARQNRPSEAEPIYRRALEIQERTLGAEHPSITITRSYLASALNKQGELDAGAEINREVLADWEKTFGPHDPKVGTVLYNLANGLYLQGKYSEAESYYRRSLQIQKDNFGPNSAKTAFALQGLGNVLFVQKRYREAADFFQRTLAIRVENLGDGHPFVANAHGMLAGAQLRLGQFKAADKSCKNVIRICAKVTCDKAQLATATFRLAKTTLELQGDKRSAIEHAQKARRILKTLPRVRVGKSLDYIEEWLRTKSDGDGL